VQVVWQPVTRLADGASVRDLAGYLVYRRADEEDWRRLTPEPLLSPSFQDVVVVNSVAYTYKIRAVRRLGPDLLESRDSPAVAAIPEDVTPPPPLLNLVAVPTAKGVELRWDPSPAPDLAGYRVYRRRAQEAHYSRLTPELLKKPYYVDSQVVRGQTYHYYITAVDDARRANESLPSEETAATYN
jgi:hypothetical protein